MPVFKKLDHKGCKDIQNGLKHFLFILYMCLLTILDHGNGGYHDHDCSNNGMKVAGAKMQI